MKVTVAILASVLIMSLPVLAFLVALMTPALSAAREDAKQRRAANLVRVVDASVSAFEAETGHLPENWDDVKSRLSSGGSSPTPRRSFCVCPPCATACFP